MKSNKIDGYQFHNMLLNGLTNLKNNETMINDLNVFPVPDGDTGTNMSLTLQNGLDSAEVRPEMGAYLKTLSEGMLFGARGNSGVILSQIFRGIFQGLSRCGYVNSADLIIGLIKGYKTGYAAVSNPKEGTILTVCREGIENIKRYIDKNTPIETTLKYYIDEMKKSLKKTPDLMPCLKEAGVVDSGAYGYILIFEGMYKYIIGEVLDKDVITTQTSSPKTNVINFSYFNENSEFIDGYCMEFILQLMKSKKYYKKFNIDLFVEYLNRYGNSVVATCVDKKVKVHVHTHEPAKIISLCQSCGEFLTFKLENMQLQHNEHDDKLKQNASVKRDHRKIQIVAVCDGEGIVEIFNEFGVYVVNSSNGINVSSQEFFDAILAANADKIIILPNNKNNFLAAQQAIEMCRDKECGDIYMIPTTSLVEGYFALASDVADSDDFDFRIKMMKAGLNSTNTFSVCTANKNSKIDGNICKTGDKIGLLGDTLISAKDNVSDVFVDVLSKVNDIDSMESLLIFTGKDATKEDIDNLEKIINEKYKKLEVTLLTGNQSIYEYVCGLS